MAGRRRGTRAWDVAAANVHLGRARRRGEARAARLLGLTAGEALLVRRMVRRALRSIRRAGVAIAATGAAARTCASAVTSFASAVEGARHDG